MLKQGLKDVGQHFVRAVADENLRRRDLVIVGDGSFQALGVRVRVQAQRIGQLAPNRFQHLGRRSVGIFVGVELDQLADLRLFAWGVGREPLHQRTPILLMGWIHDVFHGAGVEIQILPPHLLLPSLSVRFVRCGWLAVTVAPSHSSGRFSDLLAQGHRFEHFDPSAKAQ